MLIVQMITDALLHSGRWDQMDGSLFVSQLVPVTLQPPSSLT